jgi:glyoxylase-like metal-dependent hydrolase (beta-lactamase superfamily II)
MLVNHPDGWILVNTGPGDKSPQSLNVAPMRSRSSLLRELRELGLVPKNIAKVVLTHLHDEHAGGGTHMTSSGRVLPTFPNARYVVQKEALVDALSPSERSANLYRDDDYKPLLEAGQLDVVEGHMEIAMGVWVEPAGGPTPGHQIVVAEGPSATYAFLGTLVPTSMHLTPEVVGAADWNPEATCRSKHAVRMHAIKESWQVAPVGRDEWVRAGDLAALAAFSLGETLTKTPAPKGRAAKERVSIAV